MTTRATSVGGNAAFINVTATQVTMVATTVAALPDPVANAFARRFVTDALTPAFGVAIAAGGAVKVPVWSNGTNWIVG